MPFSWCYTAITNKAIEGINIGKRVDSYGTAAESIRELVEN